MYIDWDKLPGRLHCKILEHHNSNNKNMVIAILKYHKCILGCESCTKSDLAEWVHYGIEQGLLVCDK